MSHFFRQITAAVALLCAAAGIQAQTVPLIDAGFDAPSLGYPASWSIGSGTPTLIGGTLDIDSGESVYQSFSVLSAALYTISFDVMGEGRSRLFLSSDVSTSNFDAPVATSGSTLNEITNWGPAWTTTSYNFLGLAGASYHLYFSGKGVDGLVMDNVNIMAAPVPEPESYAMMLAGLGALGFMARRRKQSQA